MATAALRLAYCHGVRRHRVLARPRLPRHVSIITAQVAHVDAPLRRNLLHQREMRVRNAIPVLPALVEIKHGAPMVVVRIHFRIREMLPQTRVRTVEWTHPQTRRPLYDGVGAAQQMESAILQVPRAQLPARQRKLAVFAVTNERRRLHGPNEHLASLQTIHHHRRRPI